MIVSDKISQKAQSIFYVLFREQKDVEHNVSSFVKDLYEQISIERQLSDPMQKKVSCDFKSDVLVMSLLPLEILFDRKKIEFGRKK